MVYVVMNLHSLIDNYVIIVLLSQKGFYGNDICGPELTDLETFDYRSINYVIQDIKTYRASLH